MYLLLKLFVITKEIVSTMNFFHAFLISFILRHPLPKFVIVNWCTQSRIVLDLQFQSFWGRHAGAALCYLLHRTGIIIITWQYINFHKFHKISVSTERQSSLTTGRFFLQPTTCEMIPGKVLLWSMGALIPAERHVFSVMVCKVAVLSTWADLLRNRLPSQFTKQHFGV